MSEVVWLPEALADVERLHGFVLPHNPEAAARIARTILDGANRLIEMPYLGKPMGDGSARRELPFVFGSGAYVLRYMLDGTTIVIVRVWHSRENREIVGAAINSNVEE